MEPIDIGPQRGPSSVRRIEAQTKQVRREMEAIAKSWQTPEKQARLRVLDELVAQAQELDMGY